MQYLIACDIWRAVDGSTPQKFLSSRRDLLLLAISVTIDIAKFQTNWSAIFSEIQRQKNLKAFSAIEPGAAKIFKQQRKPRCSPVSEIESTETSKQGSQDNKEAIGLK